MENKARIETEQKRIESILEEVEKQACEQLLKDLMEKDEYFMDLLENSGKDLSVDEIKEKISYIEEATKSIQQELEASNNKEQQDNLTKYLELYDAEKEVLQKELEERTKTEK